VGDTSGVGASRSRSGTGRASGGRRRGRATRLNTSGAGEGLVTALLLEGIGELGVFDRAVGHDCLLVDAACQHNSQIYRTRLIGSPREWTYVATHPVQNSPPWKAFESWLTESPDPVRTFKKNEGVTSLPVTF
jgi:hypothetical protein